MHAEREERKARREMEIKCPKCRFRYDTPVSSGMTEVACVCPRCGTPFTYAVSDDSNTEQKVAEGAWQQPATQDEDRTGNMVPKSRNTLPSDSSDAFSPRDDRNKGADKTIISQNQLRPTIPLGSHRQHSPKLGGCLRNCLLAFLGTIVILSFLIVRNCHSDHSYTSEMIEETGGADADELTVDELASIGSVPCPSWLKGTWRVETEYGVVNITIYGNRIVELFNGEETRGTFRYNDGTLYCNFGDGTVTTLKANTKTCHLLYDNKAMEKQ